MIEFLTNNWQDFLLYSAYVSLALYFLLIISRRWLEIHSLKQCHHFYWKKLYVKEGKNQSFFNMDIAFSFICWLPKTIRRKGSRGDELDGPIFLCS